MTQTIYSEYPKLKSLHKRDPADNKVIDEFTDEIFSPELLGNAGWTWREKMDGTNLRIIWDGHRAEYRGRTDRAQFSDGQTVFLDEKIKSPAFEELLEQTFGNTEAVLFGELIGNKIQGNPHKIVGYEIRVYDAFVAGWWLLPASVDELANDLGLGSAEIIVTPRKVAMMMAGLKLARLAESPDHDDSWRDALGYLALGSSFPEAQA